jgi:hypothetical protein
MHGVYFLSGECGRIVDRTDGARLQVDYGKDETALVERWRVRAAKRRRK